MAIWWVAMVALLAIITTTTVSATKTVAPGFNRTKLASGTVKPDWVDAFEDGPSVSISLSFDFPQGKKQEVVSLGELLPRNLTQVRPHVVVTKSERIPKGALLTLVIVDPDARSPENPLVKNIIHGIVSNIPHDELVGDNHHHKDIWELGVENVPYFGPAPPLGIHRYYILIFHQETKINVATIDSRRYFSVRNFTRTYHLSYPIGGTFFEVSANS